MRLCRAAHNSFGGVVMMVKLRMRSPAGERRRLGPCSRCTSPLEAGTRELTAPSVKQRLAAIRHLFDWLVTGQE